MLCLKEGPIEVRAETRRPAPTAFAAAPIAAAGAAAASADHPARRAPDGELFTTPNLGLSSGGVVP